MATTTTHRVELPDGNTQTRKSKTRRYEAAVLVHHTAPVPAHWSGAWAIRSWHTTYKLAAAQAERARGYRYGGEGRKIYDEVSVVELVECDSCAELVDTDDTGAHGECVTCTRCADLLREAYMRNGATSIDTNDELADGDEPDDDGFSAPSYADVRDDSMRQHTTNGGRR